MQVPNALWLSLIAAVQMVVSQVYPDAWWAPVVISACIAVAKAIQVNMPSTERGLEQDSKFKRWLVK